MCFGKHRALKHFLLPLCLLLLLCACDRGDDPYTETEGSAVTVSDSSAASDAETDGGTASLPVESDTAEVSGEETEPFADGDEETAADEGESDTAADTVGSDTLPADSEEATTEALVVELPKVEFD